MSSSYAVAFSGVGHSELGRALDRPLGLLAVDASRAAIDDAGLSLAHIDGVATFPNLPTRGHAAAVDGQDIVSTEWMIKNLGLTNLRYWNQVSAGGIGMAIGNAIQAVANGACEHVLVFRALHRPRGGGYSQFVESVAKGDAAFTAPYGASLTPLAFALNYTRYQQLYGARREHMAAYVLAARRGANKNPHAYFRDIPMTFDDYMGSKMVADPLCLLDCDLPIDGAAALIVSSAARAADCRVPPAYVIGTAQAGWNPVSPVQYDEIQHSARTLGAGLWRSARIGPSDVVAAMLYDGFSPDIYFWLEGLGFCAEGEAYEWIQHGRVEIDGELPVNTFGGNLSEGRLHGIGHFVEGILQVQGRAGGRQVQRRGPIIVTSGMTGHGTGVVLGPDGEH